MEVSLNIRVEVDGRVVVRVSELAKLMGVNPHTIFNYIRYGKVESILLNPRDRRIFLDSVVGKENVHREFADVGEIARILKQSRSRICHHVRHNKLDHVVGPGRATLIFKDTLTTPDFNGKELVTPKEAQNLTGLTGDKLRYLMDYGFLEFVRIPSGIRRIPLDSLAKFFTINENSTEEVKNKSNLALV